MSGSRVSGLVDWLRSRFPNAEVEQRAATITDPVERLKFLRSQQPSASPASPASEEAAPPAARVPWAVILAGAALAAVGLLTWNSRGWNAPAAAKAPGAATSPTPPAAGKAAVSLPAHRDSLPEVWLVDTTGGVESYSNGLRIDTKFTTENRPRAYRPIDRRTGELTLQSRAEIQGIVFHTTESNLAQFGSRQNRTLKQFGAALLDYIRQKKSYNYLIDRFGRAWRVVREQDTAFHAGRSVWGDADYVYVDCNDSFLGVSFETQSAAGDADAIITPGQITTGKLLLEMLRHKYKIKPLNCPTHAQVSVNPSSFLIGYHTDWAGNFPFEEIGLPSNYEVPVPALTEFGFGYDPMFLGATGAQLWKGLLAAEDLVREQAKRDGVSVAQRKASLRERYRRFQAKSEQQADNELHPEKEK
jgi:hypothetical protein